MQSANVGIVNNLKKFEEIFYYHIIKINVFHSKILFQVLLTARNIFIANLALSDLLLCTFTMPLTLMDIITKYWAFGQDLVRLLCSVTFSIFSTSPGDNLQAGWKCPVYLCFLLILLHPSDSS